MQEVWLRHVQELLIVVIVFFFSLRCPSRVGKRYAESAYQEISIADGSNHVSTIVHEMMHATGNKFSLVFLKGLC